MHSPRSPTAHKRSSWCSAVAGASALHLVLPITLAILGILAILVVSYREVIDVYPGGGGADAVSTP
jgi:hypothetical protein